MTFQCSYTCRLAGGLTLLAARHIVKIVLNSYSEVTLRAGGRSANAMELHSLLALAIDEGDVVTAIADGQDAHDVMRNIESILAPRVHWDAPAADQPGEPDLVSV